MKYRIRILALSSVLLLLVFGLFRWMNSRYAAPVPIPSAAGGYYADSFLLELEAPEHGIIYYTTDGSLPTMDSLVYAGGILIENRTSQPNRINAVRNIVPDWKNYTPDPEPVSKGTVIRAIYVNNAGSVSDVLTQTYFVGMEPPSRGYTLSLVFEFDDIFGDNGIYVTGTEYDQWYLSGGSPEAMPVANFNQSIEVAALAELMDSSGDLMNQPVGIRIQGNNSREEIKKRFIMVSRQEYSGSDTFSYPLFDGVTTHSVMIKGYLPDAMAYDFLQDRSLALQRSIPVRVFLNGEYFYDSYLLERFDSHYFRQYYKVAERVLVKEAVTDEESLLRSGTNQYDEFMYWVTNTDFSDPEQWEAFQKEADLQSYLDFLAANYFFCNIDYNDYHNYMLWRNAPETAKASEDIRWKWCMYDVDTLSWVENDPVRGKAYQINVFSNDFSMDMQESAIYKSLRRNEDFRRQFILTYMDLMNNNFTPSNAQRILAKYGYSLDWMDQYFVKRPEWARKHLAEEFGLTGTPEKLTIRADSAMGSVTVNTSTIDLSSGEWSGLYFTDYPVTVTAKARDGYQFLGWKGAAESTEEAVTIPVDGGVTLEAVFAKK